MNSKASGILVVFATITMTAIRASAGAIEVPMQDSRAAGQADAFTAQADDPSAVFYNPAGLTQIHGNQLSVGALGLFPEWSFEGSHGQGGQAMRLPSLLPHIYAASDLGTDRLRVGIGVNNEFGINEDWGNKGPLRTSVDEAHLAVLNVSPAIAYQLDDHFSVGVALNIYYGELSLNRNALLGAPPIPEGTFHLRGHDFAVGATPSFMWKIDARNQIGAFYRSPFTLNLDGTAQVKAPGIAEIGPSHAVTPLSLPQSVGVGYAMRPIDSLKVEADVIWTDWASVNQLRIQSPNNVFNGQTIPANWMSGFTFRLGTQYEITRNWTVRAGYAYSQNAVPDSTFSPIVPDSNYHLFSVGVGYSTEHWELAAAYEFIYRETRHIEGDINASADGTWNNTINGVMLTFTVKL